MSCVALDGQNRAPILRVVKKGPFGSFEGNAVSVRPWRPIGLGGFGKGYRPASDTDRAIRSSVAELEIAVFGHTVWTCSAAMRLEYAVYCCEDGWRDSGKAVPGAVEIAKPKSDRGQRAHLRGIRGRTERYDSGIKRSRLHDECWVTPIQRLETWP